MHGPKAEQQRTAGLGFIQAAISSSGINQVKLENHFALRKYSHGTRNVFVFTLITLPLLPAPKLHIFNAPAYQKRRQERPTEHTYTPPPLPP